MAVVAGCGSDNSVKLASVEGFVTHNGIPLEDAWVEFFPEFQGRPSFGRTDESGHFVLTYTAHKGGALIGKYQVKIGTGGQPSDPSQYGAPDVPKQQLFEKSGVEVRSGQNVLEFEVRETDKR